MDTVFGILYEVPTGYFGDISTNSNIDGNDSALNPSDVPAEIMALVEKRKQLKAGKDYKAADEIREQLRSKGFEVKDGAKGSYEVFLVN